MSTPTPMTAAQAESELTRRAETRSAALAALGPCETREDRQAMPGKWDALAAAERALAEQWRTTSMASVQFPGGQYGAVERLLGSAAHYAATTFDGEAEVSERNAERWREILAADEQHAVSA